MMQYHKIDVSEGIDVNETSASKKVGSAIIGFLEILDINLKSMFVMDVIVY